MRLPYATRELSPEEPPARVPVDGAPHRVSGDDRAAAAADDVLNHHQQPSPTSSVIWTSATNVAVAAVGAVTGILAARLLGPNGRGELAVVQMLPTLLASLAMLGMPEALTYWVARDRERGATLLTSATLVCVAGSLVAAPLGYVLIGAVLEGDVVDESRQYLALLAVFPLVHLAHHPLRSLGRFMAWNAFRLAPGLGWLVLLLIHRLGDRPRPADLAMQYLLVLTALIVPTILVARRRIGIGAPSRAATRRLLAFGLPAAATTVPQALNLRLDQVLIAAVLPAEDLGLYVAAVAWSGAVSPVVSAMGSVLLPRVASADDAAERRRLIGQSGRIGTLLAVVLAVPLVAVTPIAVPVLFGSAFSSAVPSALVLVGANVMLTVAYILGEATRGLNAPGRVLVAEVAGLLATVIGLVVTLPSIGIMGAAVSSVLGYAVVLATLAVGLSRSTGASPLELLVPSRADVGAVAARVRGAVRR